MKEIYLLNAGLVTLVDDEDYERVVSRSWYADKNRNTYYARSAKSKNAPAAKMHRFILGVSDPALLVDHINGNGLDNTRGNLRIATNRQNSHNRWAVQSSSGYKGVSQKPNGKFRAYIYIGKSATHLGYFETKEDAALAYNMAALKHFGEFARLNEI